MGDGAGLRIGLGRDALERCGGRVSAVAPGAEVVVLERDGSWEGAGGGVGWVLLVARFVFP